MNYNRFGVAAILASCLTAGFSGAACAQNIVVNPGFETGTFSPWVASVSGFDITQVNHDQPHTGTYAGEFLVPGGGAPSFGSLSQSLTTVNGQTYTLDFWLTDSNSSLADPADPFTVQWDGAALPTLSLPNDGDYHEYTFDVTATGTSAALEFDTPDMDNVHTWQIELDDVSVTADASTPEPGSLTAALAFTVFGAGFALRRRRRAAPA